MNAAHERCRQCGTAWPVTMSPRPDILCTTCAHTPRLPDGEVRVDAAGTTAVCLGGDRYLRWKIIGVDPDDVAVHGWRADRDVSDWSRLGNVCDLRSAEQSTPVP